MTTTIEKTAKTTTIELDAENVAKTRACLLAIGRKQTVEEFINEFLFDNIEPHSGVFEGLIENEKRRESMEAKLAQILTGKGGAA